MELVPRMLTCHGQLFVIYFPLTLNFSATTTVRQLLLPEYPLDPYYTPFLRIVPSPQPLSLYINRFSYIVSFTILV